MESQGPRSRGRPRQRFGQFLRRANPLIPPAWRPLRQLGRRPDRLLSLTRRRPLGHLPRRSGGLLLMTRRRLLPPPRLPQRRRPDPLFQLTWPRLRQAPRPRPASLAAAGPMSAAFTDPRPRAPAIRLPRWTAAPAARRAGSNSLATASLSSTRAAISTPASLSSAASRQPSSSPASTTVRLPGSTPCRCSSRCAAPASRMPGRSLPANSRGDSTAPAATTMARARIFSSRFPRNAASQLSWYQPATAVSRWRTAFPARSISASAVCTASPAAAIPPGR